MAVIFKRGGISLKKELSLFIFLLLNTFVWGQYAPGRNWKQIETENFRIIFPETLTDRVVSLAEEMEEIYQLEGRGFDPLHSRGWTIILTAEDRQSNGFVSLPPRRSVWSALPSGESMPPVDWLDLLALHEGRHMVQYDTLNRKLNRILYFLGGQSGMTVGLYWGIPGWLMEGDAVGAETAYSSSGRGRDPLFYRQMKEIILREDFSYQKMINRSFRHYIPNEYVTGYFLTSYLKNHYGEESLNVLLDGPASLPFPALGMYKGLKKIGGTSWSRLYQDMAEELRMAWEEQNRRIKLIENRTITEPVMRDYTLWDPLSFDNNRIIARRVSLSGPARLVEITPQGMTDLIRVPPGEDMTLHGDRAVWTFGRSSPIYDSLVWSDLVSVNIYTGTMVPLTKGKHYSMPAFSPDGSRLAAVSWDARGRQSLVLLNSFTGEETDSYPVPEYCSAGYPAWSADSRVLYLTIQSREGRAIVSLDRKSREWKYLKDFSFETVKTPGFYKGSLLYTSNLTGLENVMVMDTGTGQVRQVSSRHNSVRLPLAGQWEGEEVLLYSEYTSVLGEQLALQEIRPESWIPREKIEPADFLYYPENPEDFPDYREILSGEEAHPEQTVEDYSLAEGFVNIHSWGITPNLETGTGLALYVRSDDVMDTFGWSLGGEVDVNELSRGGFFNLDWRGGLPDAAWNNRYWYRDINGTMYQDLSSLLLLSLPLNFDSPLWYHRVLPYTGAGGQALIPEDSGRGDTETYFPLYFGLQGLSVLPGGPRSLNPLWGIAGQSHYTFSPLDERGRSLFSTTVEVYLPGGFRNTGFVLEGAYEVQDSSYQSRVLFSRGYDAVKGDELYKFSGSYEFPLLYPDLALGSWIYARRVRGEFFYDHTSVRSSGEDYETYRSLGASVSVEFYPFNAVRFPLSLGIRYAWLVEEEKPSFQILFLTLGL